MTTLNPSSPLRRQAPVRRTGWRPSLWTYALFIAWLAMLSAPLLMLDKVSDGASAAGAEPTDLRYAMPIAVPII